MAYLRLRRLIDLAVLDRPGLARWLRPGGKLGLWRELQSEVTVLDEAVVMAPWGGAWQVWTCRPNGVADG